MIDSEGCDRLIKQYYREMYNYCLAKLRYNSHAAEDCVQELFVIFFRKRGSLEETENIRIWLYRAADNVIKAYLRKNDSSMTVSLDDSPEAMNKAAPDEFPDSGDILPDCLTDEEKEIVRVYYDSGYGDKKAAAKRLGMTVPALYQRIHKIKKKLKAYKSDS